MADDKKPTTENKSSDPAAINWAAQTRYDASKLTGPKLSLTELRHDPSFRQAVIDASPGLSERLAKLAEDPGKYSQRRQEYAVREAINKFIGHEQAAAWTRTGAVTHAIGNHLPGDTPEREAARQFIHGMYKNTKYSVEDTAEAAPFVAAEWVTGARLLGAVKGLPILNRIFAGAAKTGDAVKVTEATVQAAPKAQGVLASAWNLAKASISVGIKTGVTTAKASALPIALSTGLEQDSHNQELKVDGKVIQEHRSFRLGEWAGDTLVSTGKTALMFGVGRAVIKANFSAEASAFRGAVGKYGSEVVVPKVKYGLASMRDGIVGTVNAGRAQLGNMVDAINNYVFAPPGQQTGLVGGVSMNGAAAFARVLSSSLQSIRTFATSNVSMGNAVRFVQRFHYQLEDSNLGKVAAAALEAGKSGGDVLKTSSETRGEISRFYKRAANIATDARALATRIDDVKTDVDIQRLDKELSDFVDRFGRITAPVQQGIANIKIQTRDLLRGVETYVENLHAALEGVEGEPILSNAGRLRYHDVATQLQTNLERDTQFLHAVQTTTQRLDNATQDIGALNNIVTRVRNSFARGDRNAAAATLLELETTIKRTANTANRTATDFLTHLEEAVKGTETAPGAQNLGKIGSGIIEPQLSRFFSLRNNALVRIRSFEMGFLPEWHLDDYKRFDRMLPRSFTDSAHWALRDIEGAQSRVSRGTEKGGGMVDMPQRWAEYIRNTINTLTDTASDSPNNYSRLTPAQRRVADDLVTEVTRWNVMRYGLWRTGGFPATFGDTMIQSLTCSDELKTRLKIIVDNQNRQNFPNPIRRLVKPYADRLFYPRHILDARNDFLNENSGYWLGKRLKELPSYLFGRKINAEETAKAAKADPWRYDTVWSGWGLTFPLRMANRLLLDMPVAVGRRVGWKAVGGTAGVVVLTGVVGGGGMLVGETSKAVTGHDLTGELGSRVIGGQIQLYDRFGGGSARFLSKLPFKAIGWEWPQNWIDANAHVRPELLGIRIGGFTPFSDRFDNLTSSDSAFGIPAVALPHLPLGIESMFSGGINRDGGAPKTDPAKSLEDAIRARRQQSGQGSSGGGSSSGSSKEPTADDIRRRRQHSSNEIPSLDEAFTAGSKKGTDAKSLQTLADNRYNDRAVPIDPNPGNKPGPSMG